MITISKFNLRELLKNEKDLAEILETILNLTYDGIVVVDENGYIRFFNKAYQEFMGKSEDEVIGRHVTEVIENTRMHIVVKTGIPEIGDVQEINGHTTIVMREPIIKDGEIIGAVGKVMFKDIAEFNIIAKKIESMKNEIEYYKHELKKAYDIKYSFNNIIGVSEKIKEVKYLAERASHSISNVLVLGESGTGKELIAKAIHYESNRASKPFVAVNCAAIPDELLESELFGYEEGAFTGAKKGGKAGKFELADRGTLFLDEIGDMPYPMQVKLLRVLQERVVERLGSNKPKKIDVRIICATNKNLEKLIEEGKFREDLYYRINVLTIEIPSLRERKEDIESLSKFLINKLSVQMGRYVDKISSDALKLLTVYDWPGNVRQLENVLERAINLIDYGSCILPSHLPPFITKEEMPSEVKKSEISTLDDMIELTEKDAIIDALKKTNGNKLKAAKVLGISRTTLYEKLKKYNL